jgi:hypothetical protein
MRTLIASLIALILGTALGWYFGYTRPVARNSWRIAQITGWVPSQISDAYNYPDETFRKLVGTQQEAVARASLSALTCLEDGQTDRAKDFLVHAWLTITTTTTNLMRRPKTVTSFVASSKKSAKNRRV